MLSSTRRHHHRGATGILVPCPWGTARSSQSSSSAWSCALLHYRAIGSKYHTLPVSQVDRGLWEAAGPCMAPPGALAQPLCCTLWLCPHPWMSVSGCCSRSSCQPKVHHSGSRSAPNTGSPPLGAGQCQGHMQLLPTVLSLCGHCCAPVRTLWLHQKQTKLGLPRVYSAWAPSPHFLHAYSPHAPIPG